MQYYTRVTGVEEIKDGTRDHDRSAVELIDCIGGVYVCLYVAHRPNQCVVHCSPCPRETHGIRRKLSVKPSDSVRSLHLEL